MKKNKIVNHMLYRNNIFQKKSFYNQNIGSYNQKLSFLQSQVLIL